MNLRFKNWSLKYKLLVVCLLISTIPVIVLGVISYQLAKDAIYKEITEKITSQVNFYKEYIRVEIDEIEDGEDYNAEVADVKSTFKRKLKAEKVGETGYMYVMDTEGNIIIHPNSEGANLYEHAFVQDICRMKKGAIFYPWEGRMKIVVFDYYEKFDWIIASGSYLKDFTGPLRKIQYFIIGIVLIASFLVIIIASLFAQSISKGMNIIVNKLKMSSEQISKSSDQLVNASTQLSSASQQVATGASEQASQIEETTSSVEELTSMVRQNTANAKEASNLAEKTGNDAETGFKQMQNMHLAMKDINESSDEIKKVIKVIDDIAFQTNILALNAAVEAARAGEVGMGFAVVADEVKDLANRSQEAAKETADMIESTISKSQNGLNIATELIESYKEILAGSKKVNEVATEVEAASNEQQKGLEQVNKAIIELDKVVQDNASSAEETASSAEETSSSSEELSSQADVINVQVDNLLRLINGVKKRIQKKNNEDTDPDDKELQEEFKKFMAMKKSQSNNKKDNKKLYISDKSNDSNIVIERTPEDTIPFTEDDEFLEM